MRLRTKEDLTPLEELALIDMSYSRIDTYQMCSAKYFYTYVVKEERLFGAAAALGNIVHGVLEDIVGEPLDSETALAQMDTHRETYDPERQIEDKLINAGKEMLIEFIDRHEGDLFEIVGKELEFQIVVGSALVRGFIDLVARRDDAIHIVDWKSGTWEVAKKNIPNLQLAIYALAAHQLFPDENVYAELYYLRSGRRKGHLFKPEDMDGVYNWVLKEVNTIIEDQNFNYTSNERFCFFCDHAKSGVCSVGVKRNAKRGW